MSREEAEPDERRLNDRFVADLGRDLTLESDPAVRPLLGTLRRPAGLRIAAYLWLATAPYERQPGAHKIQITVPGVPRGDRVRIPRERGRLVLFVGFSVEFDVWVLWDAELFMGDEGISWSRNLQVPVEALSSAALAGLTVATKHVRETAIGPAPTTIVACRRSRLVDGIAERFRLGIDRQVNGAE